MIRDTFTIPATHPCLAGHFPGDPIVPGSVLLDYIACSLRKNDLQIETLNQAKFIKPAKAEQFIEMELSIVGANVDYNLTHKGALIASGQITIMPL